MTSQPAAERVARALAGVEALPDPAARDAAVEALGEVLELHGAALGRIVEALSGSAAPAGEALTALADDELVAPVLLVHGLHPVPLRTRVEGALESVRPLMDAHGGGVELLGITDDIVSLRLVGSCHGCPSSTLTLKGAVEAAIAEAAPDVVALEVEGASPEPQPRGHPSLRSLPVVSSAGVVPRCGDGIALSR